MVSKKTVREIRVILFQTDKKVIVPVKANFFGVLLPTRSFVTLTNEEGRNLLFSMEDQEELNVSEHDTHLIVWK